MHPKCAYVRARACVRTCATCTCTRYALCCPVSRRFIREMRLFLAGVAPVMLVVKVDTPPRFIVAPHVAPPSAHIPRTPKKKKNIFFWTHIHKYRATGGVMSTAEITLGGSPKTEPRKDSSTCGERRTFLQVQGSEQESSRMHGRICIRRITFNWLAPPCPCSQYQP